MESNEKNKKATYTPLPDEDNRQIRTDQEKTNVFATHLYDVTPKLNFTVSSEIQLITPLGIAECIDQ